MISRRSAKAIADAYTDRFVGMSRSAGRVSSERLYDFLYVHNFDAWLLNATQILSIDRSLTELLMKLHTGESVPQLKWEWPQRERLGQRVLQDLAESLIHDRLTAASFRTGAAAVDAMRRILELDGYVFRDGRLLVPEESVLDEREERGVLERLFELKLAAAKTLKHHLDLSADHYRGERWDDSIANSRKVLDLVLKQLAIRYSQASGKPLSTDDADRPVKVRDYLERHGILEKKEKEVVEKIYGLLSDTGAHPYIARAEQARLLRHYALTTCQFALLRLGGALESKAAAADPPANP